MTDPITFNTDKGSVGSSRVKNGLGMAARLGPGTGLGWASVLDALEQDSPGSPGGWVPGVRRG